MEQGAATPTHFVLFEGANKLIEDQEVIYAFDPAEHGKTNIILHQPPAPGSLLVRSYVNLASRLLLAETPQGQARPGK